MAMQNGSLSNGHVNHIKDVTKSTVNGDICNGNAVMNGIQHLANSQVRQRQTSKESHQNISANTVSDAGNTLKSTFLILFFKVFKCG